MVLDVGHGFLTFENVCFIQNRVLKVGFRKISEKFTSLAWDFLLFCQSTPKDTDINHSKN